MNKLGLAALCLGACACAHAESYLSPTAERVRLSLGGVYYTSSTDLRVDSSKGVVGSDINGEDDFGLSKHNVEPKFEAVVRAAERHRLRFDYFTLDRDGHTTLTQPFIFRDVVLLSGDPLESHLSLRTLGITYEYSVLHRERFEVAATLGVHITDISTRARVNSATRHINQTEDQAGPIPTLGLDATWVISKRFYLDGRAQYLKVNVKDLDGSLGIYEVSALYRLRPNISFALGYAMTRASLASTERDTSGLFNFNTKGPEAFVRIAF
jgi:hypothetical protein